MFEFSLSLNYCIKNSGACYFVHNLSEILFDRWNSTPQKHQAIIWKILKYFLTLEVSFQNIDLYWLILVIIDHNCFSENITV